jgi:hypothetical protein
MIDMDMKLKKIWLYGKLIDWTMPMSKFLPIISTKQKS